MTLSPAERRKVSHVFPNGKLRVSDQVSLPVPTVDQVMVEERASSFARRSIKSTAKLAGLKIIASMMDLTTLEGKDTPGKIAYLCRKAVQPADPKYDVPPC